MKEVRPLKIDAHQHYWKINRGDYGWITPEIPTLYKDFLPGDLVPHLRDHHIDQTILVQAAPTIEETEFLLDLSSESGSIAGVVGWIDLLKSDYQVQYARLKKHPKFIGFRLMIQDMPDETVILKEDYIKALRYFAEKDVPIDLLFVHHQLPTVIRLLEQVPNLRGVVNHIGKPDIAHQVFEPWKTEIGKLAQYQKIYCKLSGMVTEADHDHWKLDDFTAFVHHVLSEFGTDRVMFGSDWPVCLLAGSYDDVVHILQQSLPEYITDTALNQLFGENAKRFYKLSESRHRE